MKCWKIWHTVYRTCCLIQGTEGIDPNNFHQGQSCLQGGVYVLGLERQRREAQKRRCQRLCTGCEGLETFAQRRVAFTKICVWTTCLSETVTAQSVFRTCTEQWAAHILVMFNLPSQTLALSHKAVNIQSSKLNLQRDNLLEGSVRRTSNSA